MRKNVLYLNTVSTLMGSFFGLEFIESVEANEMSSDFGI